MPDIKNLYAEQGVERHPDSYIEIQSTKGIKGSFATRMDVNADKIFWNIRFNIPLNPDTVNEENMDVTDVDGYTLTSVISYNTAKHAIIISPREQYKPNSTYVLNVSTNVTSKGNNPLKEEVQVVFQLKGSEISSFKILKGEDRLDIDIKPSRNAPTPSQLKKNRVAVMNIKVNFNIAIGALIIFAASMMIKNFLLTELSMLLLLAGIAHIVYQYANRRHRSILLYNRGAKCYNNSEFADAAEYFEKALICDPGNAFALRGQKKLSSASNAKKKKA